MCFYRSIFAINILNSHIGIVNLSIDMYQENSSFVNFKTYGFELADFPKLL